MNVGLTAFLFLGKAIRADNYVLLNIDSVNLTLFGEEINKK